jgi:hypothetical protein
LNCIILFWCGVLYNGQEINNEPHIVFLNKTNADLYKIQNTDTFSGLLLYGPYTLDISLYKKQTIIKNPNMSNVVDYFKNIVDTFTIIGNIPIQYKSKCIFLLKNKLNHLI